MVFFEMRFRDSFLIQVIFRLIQLLLPAEIIINFCGAKVKVIVRTQRYTLFFTMLDGYFWSYYSSLPDYEWECFSVDDPLGFVEFVLGTSQGEPLTIGYDRNDDCVRLTAGYLRKKKVLELGITLMDQRLRKKKYLPRMHVDVSSTQLMSMLEHVEAALAQPEVEAPVWNFCYSRMSMNGIVLGDIEFGSITVHKVDINPKKTFTLCFDDRLLRFLLDQLANLAPFVSFRLGMNQKTELSIDMGMLGRILIVRLDA